MAKKSSIEGENEELDDIEITDDGGDVEIMASAKDKLEARRRLEQLLEDRALERIINGYY